MRSLADRTILALRSEHEQLAALATTLTDEQLAETSGASEWSVAQVFSHLGSGAEITLAGLQAALSTTPEPGSEDFNQRVWDRWNSLPPREQMSRSGTQNALLLDTFGALDEEQRDSLQLDVGFLPEPISVSSFAGMRLNEFTQHSWDVRVSVDAGAGLAEDSAKILAEQFAGGLGFLLGFFGKAGSLTEPTVLDLRNSGFGLTIDDTVTMVAPAVHPTATFAGPLESAIRLISGRLAPQYTPTALTVSGNVTLDDLREVFPGF